MIHATLKVNNKNGIFWLPQFDSRYGQYLDTLCKRLSFSIVFLFHCCDYFMIYMFFIIMIFLSYFLEELTLHFFSAIVAITSTAISVENKDARLMLYYSKLNYLVSIWKFCRFVYDYATPCRWKFLHRANRKIRGKQYCT